MKLMANESRTMQKAQELMGRVLDTGGAMVIVTVEKTAEGLEYNHFLFSEMDPETIEQALSDAPFSKFAEKTVEALRAKQAQVRQYPTPPRSQEDS